MEHTPQQTAALARDWSEIGKEPVRVDARLGNVIYGFGSELACLRLYHKYTMARGAGLVGAGANGPAYRVGFSVPMDSWYFSLTIR